MNPDYEGLVKYMQEEKRIPLVIFYAKETENGVDLNWFYTPAYDDADDKLKSDIKNCVKNIQL